MKKLLLIIALLFVAFPIVAMRVPGRAIARIFAMQVRELHTTDNDINALAKKFPGEEFEKRMQKIEDSDALKKLLHLCKERAIILESKASRSMNDKLFNVCLAGVGVGAGSLSYGFFSLNDFCLWVGCTSFFGSYAAGHISIYIDGWNRDKVLLSRRNLRELHSQIERAEEWQDARRD
jgi:hypothetical protein